MKPNIFLNTFYETDFSDMRSPQIVVYFDPTDFPGKYVARLHEALASIPCGVDLPKGRICTKCNKRHLGTFVPAVTNHVVVKDTLDEVRNAIPHMFSQLNRSPEDDPKILEVWI